MDKMNSYLVLVVLCFSKTFQFAEITDVVKDLSLPAFCPYTQFCRNKHDFDISNESDEPCCAFCQCTSDCHLHGNCCPDIQHTVNETLVQPVCHFPVHNADTETLRNFNKNIYTGINSYNSFVTCPKTYKNRYTIERCEGKQNTIEDLTVVSDLQDIVYRNKYCATCHGINTTISWNLKVKCRKTKDLIEFRMEDGLETLGNCMIWSLPPNPDTGKFSKCFKAFDSCNMTGKLPNYPGMQLHHDAMQSACQAYTLYYFEATLTRKRNTLRVFRNIHCFFCNAFNVLLQEFCPLQQFENMDEHDLNAKVAMINQTLFTTLKTESNQTKERKCSRSQVYDSLFGTCRQLRCPPTYIASYGECIESFVKTNGLSVSIPIELWPVLVDGSFDSKKYIFDSSIFIDLNNLMELLSKTIISPKAECNHCFTITNIPRNSNEENITAIISFQTTDKCDIKNLYSSLNTYAESSEKLIVLKNAVRTMRFKTVLKYDYIQDETDISKRDQNVNINICDQSHLYNGELICPKLMLNETEYKLLKARGTFRGPVRKMSQICPDSYDKDNGTHDDARKHKISFKKNATCSDFDVCLHDYLTAVSNGNRFKKKQSVEIIFATISVAAYLKKFFM